jgi:serine/threonine protein kinase
MEYLEGETLADRLKKGALPTKQTLEYARQIADALDAAHGKGVVHRDLKPGNIMLTKSGAKLLDFGLAKVRSSAVGDETLTQALTSEGTLLGTLQYMAPEQLEAKEVDSRTDIFAFGEVLYEMATGRKAFAGRSQASLIANIMHVDPPPVSTMQPATPPALDRVIQRCLAKDPNQRWQNVRDLWTGNSRSRPLGTRALTFRGSSLRRRCWPCWFWRSCISAARRLRWPSPVLPWPRLKRLHSAGDRPSPFRLTAGGLRLSP